jgi:hypothetical protein
MPIRFLPNDPLAQDILPTREQSPRQDPPDPRAGFSYAAEILEDLYALDSPEFLFWQCREAALATLDTWAALATPPTSWQNGQRLLPLRHDAGRGLNAQYDRTAVSFLGWETDTRKTFSGASTDAVAHEVGHALLDAMRPELWDSVYTEPAAFHEAFADCMALLVSLFDPPSRQALLQGGSQLRTQNFLEAVAEDVAEGIRLQEGAGHPQSVPRRGLNAFQWEIPINLPPLGPPAHLTSEAHSFSQIFTGCFYDTVCNIFALQPNQDEQGLLAAAQTAGRLLIAGARDAPEVARFFQAVGRAMILADEAATGGAHHQAIRDGFASHNVAIGSSAMLAPTTGLAGAAPRVDAGGSKSLLPAAARRDLLGRIRAPRRARLIVSALRLGGRAITNAVHHREVLLSKLDRRLKGVVAPAVESMLIGSSAARPVVLGQLPDPTTTVDEVNHFVGTLLKHGALLFAAAKGAALKGVAARKQGAESPFLPTHAIRTRAGQLVLKRIRFACCPSGRDGKCWMPPPGV